MSSLISHLLENAIEDAIEKGKVPEVALSGMKRGMDQVAEFFADDWQDDMNMHSNSPDEPVWQEQSNDENNQKTIK